MSDLLIHKMKCAKTIPWNRPTQLNLTQRRQQRLTDYSTPKRNNTFHIAAAETEHNNQPSIHPTTNIIRERRSQALNI